MSPPGLLLWRSGSSVWSAMMTSDTEPRWTGSPAPNGKKVKVVLIDFGGVVVAGVDQVKPLEGFRDVEGGRVVKVRLGGMKSKGE